MRLIMHKKDGKAYEKELPRRKSKHRVPQKGETVTHKYGDSVFSGTVTAVHYEYDQPQGFSTIATTKITVVLEEI